MAKIAGQTAATVTAGPTLWGGGVAAQMIVSAVMVVAARRRWRSAWLVQ